MSGDDVLLDLIHGFAMSLVDLAFPHFSPISIHDIPWILPQIFLFPHSSSSLSTDLAPQTSGLMPGHPVPGNGKRLHHHHFSTILPFFTGVSTITSTYHHCFPQQPPSLNRYHLQQYWLVLVFEILSCGSRVLLCFSYIGTVRHQHHHRSSSSRTRHRQQPPLLTND